MNKYLRNAMWVGLSAVAAVGLAGCNGNAGTQGLQPAATTSSASAANAAAAPTAAPTPQYADVISATPIRQTVNNPSQQCHQQAVTVQKPVKDTHQILGTALGVVVGGLVGNQVGGGNGKKIATVVGAAAGGYAGHEIQEHHQKNATETVNKQVCQTVNNKTTRIVGYTVKYKYNGTVHTTRMDHDPGARVQIKHSISVTN